MKPYKEEYYQELTEEKVHKENVEKDVDLSFGEPSMNIDIEKIWVYTKII